MKFCRDYMMNFSPGAKRIFAWENLLRYENTARAEVPFSIQGLFARMAALKILARFQRLGLIQPEMKPSPCNQALISANHAKILSRALKEILLI